MEIVVRPGGKHEILTQEFRIISDGQTKQTPNHARQVSLFSLLPFFKALSFFDPYNLLCRFRICYFYNFYLRVNSRCHNTRCNI
jgi:hypothetical protein